MRLPEVPRLRDNDFQALQLGLIDDYSALVELMLQSWYRVKGVPEYSRKLISPTRLRSFALV